MLQIHSDVNLLLPMYYFCKDQCRVLGWLRCWM